MGFYRLVGSINCHEQHPTIQTKNYSVNKCRLHIMEALSFLTERLPTSLTPLARKSYGWR